MNPNNTISKKATGIIHVHNVNWKAIQTIVSWTFITFIGITVLVQMPYFLIVSIREALGQAFLK